MTTVSSGTAFCNPCKAKIDDSLGRRGLFQSFASKTGRQSGAERPGLRVCCLPLGARSWRPGGRVAVSPRRNRATISHIAVHAPLNRAASSASVLARLHRGDVTEGVCMRATS